MLIFANGNALLGAEVNILHQIDVAAIDFTIEDAHVLADKKLEPFEDGVSYISRRDRTVVRGNYSKHAAAILTAELRHIARSQIAANKKVTHEASALHGRL